MMQTNVPAASVCAQCGAPIEPDMTVCPACGAGIAVPEAPAQTKKPSKAGRALRTVCSVLLSVLFALLLAAMALLLFLQAVSHNAPLPMLGSLNTAAVLDAWYAIALGALLTLIPLILLFVANRRCLRRAFVYVGASLLSAAALCLIGRIVAEPVLRLLHSAWQNALIEPLAVGQDFLTVSALLLLAAGAVCLSVYFCIAAGKGDSHGKGA